MLTQCDAQPNRINDFLQRRSFCHSQGIDPAPERQSHTTWKEFLRIHWDVLAATDFFTVFTVEVWTAVGLVRYHVLFVIRLATRELHIAGIVPEPDGQWMKQMARNLSDGLDGLLGGYQYLIHDRSSLFTPEFCWILDAVGIESVRLPARSPNLNAIAERFVRSIRESCLDHLVLIGEASLPQVPRNSFFIITTNETINHWTTKSSDPNSRPSRRWARSNGAAGSVDCSMLLPQSRLNAA